MAHIYAHPLALGVTKYLMIMRMVRTFEEGTCAFFQTTKVLCTSKILFPHGASVEYLLSHKVFSLVVASYMALLNKP